jgi:hypothetical protein
MGAPRHEPVATKEISMSRQFPLALVAVSALLLAGSCGSVSGTSDVGGTGGQGGKATGGSGGGAAGHAGTAGQAGGSAGGASATGGNGSGSAGTSGGAAGPTGSGGSGAGGGSTGSGGSTGGGGSTGNGGTIGSGGTMDAGGAAGAATGGASGGTAGGNAGGHGGAAGSSGAGGATNCAGHAISFNANSGANGDPAKASVLVTFNGSADLPTGNTNRTIEFWAYVLTSSWAADANTMFFYGTNNRDADGFGFDFGSTASGIGTIDPFTNNSATDPQGDNKPSGLMANVNQWAHFAMTWDGTNVRAFVNGVEKVAVPIAMLNTGMTALTIGGYPPAYFNGYIDEFRIWNVARAAEEISSTMGHTLVGNEAGLTGYWRFDETSGTTAADSVTSAGHTAHPGTLSADTTAHNPTWVVSTAPISCP